MSLEKRFEKEFKLRILKKNFFSFQMYLNLKYEIFPNLFKILKFLKLFLVKYDF